MGITVILLCVAAAWWIDSYTYHGMGIEVPDLTKVNFSRAKQLLEEKGLQIMVNDSGYNKQYPADCILAQSPVAGSKVKTGRTIYVTVNSPSSPTFAIPDVIDNCSAREAEARLSAMGFQLTPHQLVNGEKDWVYGIVCRGRHISTGDRVSIDSPLTLQVGDGMYDAGEMDVEYVDNGNATPEDGATDEFVEVTEP